MNYKYIGENIQSIRKLKGLTQQELADKIGINLQSLSKIERGINTPTYETLEKIMCILEITPNEILSGPLKIASHMEAEILKFIEKESRLDVELAHGEYDHPFDTEEEWGRYKTQKLQEYIMTYINSQKRTAADLYPIKEFICNQKFKKLLSRFKNYYSYDLFSETLEGKKTANPYIQEKIKKIEKYEKDKIKTAVEYPDDFED